MHLTHLKNSHLDLAYRDYTRSPSGLSRSFVARVFHATRVHLRLPRGATAELSVVVVGPARMRALNRRWRKMDTATDVLAFPLSGPTIKGYTAVSLGDLFICPPVVRAKAEAMGNSIRFQMEWTVVHGLLHLAGYDHEKGRAAAMRMAALERKILKELGNRS